MSSEIRTPLPKRENNRTQPHITKLRGMLDKVKAGAPAHDDGIRFFKTLDTVDTFETSPPPMVKIYARSLQFVMIMRPPPTYGVNAHCHNIRTFYSFVFPVSFSAFSIAIKTFR